MSEAEPGEHGPTTDDRFLGGRLTLRQPSRGHRAGSDAVLLAASVAAAPGALAIDLGAGVGAAGLALARRSGARVLLVEIDAALAALAEENIGRNGLAGAVGVRCDDVATLRPADIADFAPADHVLANPPFNPPYGRAPPDERTARARVATAGLFATWAQCAARLLRPGGSFTLICRPDSLAAVLAALDGRFGALALRFVHATDAAAAVRLIVGAVKDSRAPLQVLAPLVLNGPDGHFTAAAEAIHRDAAALGGNPT